ncbi:hypothetical protein [Streptomyces sp. NPDC093099]|uniref:hypothetical protein n=1 Tax=Streptomyces sp. NPDC093099 TaxID=3366028 RepID=UPI00382C1DBC
MTIDDEESEEPNEELVSRIIKVTPELAEIYLSKATVNRRLNAGQVRTLMETIIRGEWKLTHQGIAFDSNGTLLDGQHRLHAIIEANTPVEMVVFEGLSKDVFSVLDTGKRRSAADTLFSTGEKYLSQLSSTIRHVILFNTMPNLPWRGAQARVSNDQILAAYNEDPDRYRESVSIGRELSKHLFASWTAVSTAVFLTTEAAPAGEIEAWISGLKSGAGLDSHDARLALREVPKDIQKRSSKRKMNMRDQMAIYIKAWNAWVDPEKAGELRLHRLKKTEKMPMPIKLPFEFK